MTGDFSRNTFDRTKTFSLVRMQQGRLFADADWNEQGDILRSSDRDTAVDVIGHAGFPEDDPGFALLPSGADLVIGPGVGHVAGVRHELALPEALTVARISGAGDATLWQVVTGPAVQNGTLLATDPPGMAGLVVVRDFSTDAGGLRSFRTTPGLAQDTTRVFRPATFASQPHGTGAVLPNVAGNYLAVLKSTDLPVTALDDPLLREVAFDGPDTALRDRTTWQVLLVPEATLSGLGYAAADLTCPALANGFDPVIGNAVPGRMRARAEVSALAAGPCTLPPAAGYRSLDNMLYRVEIHLGGNQAVARFKWSRENAIHRTRYGNIAAGALTVDSIGRDDATALKLGDWIEIRDQSAVNGSLPGFFGRIAEVVGLRVSLAELLHPTTLQPLTQNGEPDLALLPAQGFVTRWEGGAPRPVGDGLADWTDLELGVQVRFEEGIYQPGDHWTVPGRSVSGDVEWPRDPFTQEPVAKAPEGPRRDYAALAWLARDAAGVWTVSQDCRPLFPPLTRSLQVLYAGGDGQEALPDPLNGAARVDLPNPLSVAVVRGRTPVQGEIIRFEVTQGNGRLANDDVVALVATDEQGVASIGFRLDAQAFVQEVTARRLDAGGRATHHPITFTATLSRADMTSFDPANTPMLAGSNTVQEAIEALAGMNQAGCSTYVIREGMDWVALLESLKPGENAAICFARGVYRTSRTVRLKALGHLRLSGAGTGTVTITANRVESALAFEACASVSVHDLEVVTPDGNSVVEPLDGVNRRGTLDFDQCPEVEVAGCTLRCGGGTSPKRTCLSVRNSGEALGTPKPGALVRVTGNTLIVGNLQEGILVTDAIDVDIRDNRLTVHPRTRGNFALKRFLKDKAWMAATLKTLVQRPVMGVARGEGSLRRIASREWRYLFQSPVPQRDWDELVRKSPPPAAARVNSDAFKAWAEGLVGAVVADPELLPVFRNQLKRLADTMGPDAGQIGKPEVRLAILVTSDPEVRRFDEIDGSARKIVVEANGQVLSFDSPFDQRDWTLLINRSEEGAKIANADELLGLVYQLAQAAISDVRNRKGLGSVEAWLNSLRDNGASLGQQAIVCAGRILGTVRIAGNLIREFQVGVRVATSHQRQGPFRAGSVMIDDNRMELLAPTSEAYVGFGLFVGNVDVLRIRGNDMTLSTKPNFQRRFAQGIRVWGEIGRQVLIAENRIAVATMGIRLRGLSNEDRPTWVLRENVVEGPKGTVLYKSSKPVVNRDNFLFET
jgi:hypothetical protein